MCAFSTSDDVRRAASWPVTRLLSTHDYVDEIVFEYWLLSMMLLSMMLLLMMMLNLYDAFDVDVCVVNVSDLVQSPTNTHHALTRIHVHAKQCDTQLLQCYNHQSVQKKAFKKNKPMSCIQGFKSKD
jgi:hypothetical protein